LQSQSPGAEAEAGLRLAGPQSRGCLPALALAGPPAAKRHLKGREPLADLLDHLARAAEVDRPLPALFAINEAIIGCVGPRSASAPAGHDRSLPGEEIRPRGQAGQGGMKVLVSTSQIFQFLPPYGGWAAFQTSL
jgi:hypothetical protein